MTTLGRKAILNTNGLGLSRDLLVELKRAGLVGLTFHVDSRQGRPGWRNKTESQMNELRSEFAEMVAVGGRPRVRVQLHGLRRDPGPGARRRSTGPADNIDKVHTVVFITYRAAMVDAYDYYAKGEKIDDGPPGVLVGRPASHGHQLARGGQGDRSAATPISAPPHT